MVMPHELLSTHLIADCPFRWVTSQHCNRTMMSCQMDNHNNTTTAPNPLLLLSVRNPNNNSNDTTRGTVNKRSRTNVVPVPLLLCKGMIVCPNGCSPELISRQTIIQHEKVCPFAIIECSICSLPCTRSSMTQHMNDNLPQHMVMVMAKNEELRTQVASLSTSWSIYLDFLPI
jgi:hypothetical protein